MHKYLIKYLIIQSFVKFHFDNVTYFCHNTCRCQRNVHECKRKDYRR